MGRKLQKTNRHKKLKAVDPFYTGDRKILIDKGLISANQAPNLNDDIKLPSKIREYLFYQEKLKSEKPTGKSKSNPLRHTQGPDEHGAEVPVRKTNELKKLNHESETSFLNRVNKEVEQVIHRSQYETQFDVKLEAKEDKVVMIKDKKMRAGKRRCLDKLKERIKNKKKNSLEHEKEKKSKNDVVKFGEVVHNPPMITSFPKFSTKKIVNPNTPFTIPKNFKSKNGITEKDRNDVIQRWREMKQAKNNQ